MGTISGKINLAVLPHVVLEKKGQTGMIEGIFIPFKNANLFKGENGAVYLDVIAFEMKEPKEYGTHIVKQSMPKAVREAMSKEEQEQVPILGNLNTRFGGSAVSNNAAPGGENVGEDDDLPF